MSDLPNKIDIYLDPDGSSKYLAYLHRNIRILEINSGFLIGASGYKLYKIVNSHRIFFAKLDDKKNSFLSKNRLIRRFFRTEVYSFKTLRNNHGICIAKKGIFLENKISGKFERVFQILRGSKPMSICEDKEGTIFFGEYYLNKERRDVHIYASYNSGKNWKTIYTFPPNSIRHIHTVQLDPYTGFLWVATGDEENECIIGYTSDGFKTFVEVKKGGQEFRTCKFLFLEDKIIYGTDTPYIENYIKAIIRKDLSIQVIQKVQGSVINACQIGKNCIVSTTVEPSKANKDKNSYLWISNNGSQWYQIGCFKKDIFNGTLFQFGNIRFPHYNNTNTNSLFFSGHALKGIDGHSVEVENLNDYFKVPD
jgi:hypothetical protein